MDQNKETDKWFVKLNSVSPKDDRISGKSLSFKDPYKILKICDRTRHFKMMKLAKSYYVHGSFDVLFIKIN